MRIGFLHTAEAHVPTFDDLLGELGPGVAGVHVVAGAGSAVREPQR